jgi:hypothetical protein
MIDMNNLPTITIGCPISNRRYLINRYLEAIYKLDYPKDKIKLFFLVNGISDGTECELSHFKKHAEGYLDVIIEKYKTTSRKDKRETEYRNETFKRLAELRNYMLSKIDTDYFFSVDSDIIVNPNVLIELVKAEKDIIAAVINNDKILKPYNQHPNIRTNLLIDVEKNGIKLIKHFMDFPINEIVEVNYTGAVYLMKSEVCKNIKYEFDLQGEDIPFCRNAREFGYKIYAHTGLWQNHIMCEYQQYCIDNKCQSPCIRVDKTTKVYQYKYIDNVVNPNLFRCAKLNTGDTALLNNN